MPAFVLGSLTVQVAAGAVALEYEDAALTYRDRWDGTVEVEQRGPFGRARVWALTTIPLARTAADTLRTLLLSAGTQEVSGDAIGSPPQTAYVRNITRSDVKVSGAGDGTDDRCTLQFEAVGVDG